jgi:hypothetical protein
MHSSNDTHVLRSRNRLIEVTKYPFLVACIYLIHDMLVLIVVYFHFPPCFFFEQYKEEVKKTQQTLLVNDHLTGDEGYFLCFIL